MLNVVICVGLFVLSFQTHGATSRPVSVPVEATRLQIEVVKSNITLVQSENGFKLICRVGAGEWIPSNSDKLSRWNCEKGEIHGAGFVKIVANDLMLQSQTWQSDVEVQAHKLQMISKNTKGSWRGLVHQGSIKQIAHQGDLRWDVVSASVSLSGGIGKSVIYGNRGDITIENHVGELAINGYRPRVKVLNGEGRLDLQTQQSLVNVSGFDGRVLVSSVEGAVVVKSHEKADVKVTSMQGPVELWLKKKSRAELRLETQSGRLVAPKPYRLQSYGTTTVLQGALKGDIAGRVSVRTESAPVLVKVQ